ncbi:hypothetical protein LTR93_004113 [Exophiala xenobiotica]|nr:hypothetical protein LTR93_004113 [Exophiala xenobiotica]KAK5451239.1 hypothetical protein LTR18_001258 [Exophiala xenobiotica]
MVRVSCGFFILTAADALLQGPIVRITPWELHINDPDYYDVLYSRNSPRNKYQWFANMFGTPKASIAILDHYQHRLLRSNMNPYFSMQRIRALEPEIQALVDKLCRRLNDFKGTGQPIMLQPAYTCFTTDVISDYTMGVGFHYLDEQDFIPQWSETLSGIAQGTAFFKPFPWLLTILKALPQGLVTKLNPGMGLMFAFQNRCLVLINSVIESQKSGKENFGHPTFFHDVLASDLPPEARSAERLAQEIQTIIGAGAETVAKMLSWTTYYLLENPEKLRKLKEELNRLDPNRTAALVDFEKMPYLTSVMLEGLRIAPDQALQYKQWSIPVGTPVGMTSVLMHHNETNFPDSYNFIPERWMDLESRKRLESYLVPFSKGSRQCVGQKYVDSLPFSVLAVLFVPSSLVVPFTEQKYNRDSSLARAEILLALAKLFRDVNFQLYETTREDVTMAHELFLPFPKSGSKGVRVLVR